MRGVIIVETMEEYKKWLAEQKSEYATLFEKKEETKPVADSVAPKQTAQVLPAQK